MMMTTYYSSLIATKQKTRKIILKTQQIFIILLSNRTWDPAVFDKHLCEVGVVEHICYDMSVETVNIANLRVSS